jgi:long-chain acyl-CoA synthetase
MLNAFLKIEWYNRGLKLTLKEKKIILNKLSYKRNLLLKLPQNSKVIIQDDDPLALSILFLDALDNDLCPILLPNNYTVYQREKILETNDISGSIINSKLFLTNKKTINFRKSYGVITSGTTGNPKLYYLPIDGVEKIAQSHAISLKINKRNTLVQSLPIYHSFGIMCYIFTSIVTGCGVDFHNRQFDIASIKNAHYSYGVLYLSPSLAKLYYLHNIEPILRISSVSIGGGICDLDTLMSMKIIFPNSRVFTTYGLTEAGPRLTTGEILKKTNHQSIGKSLKGVDICIFNKKNKKFSKKGIGSLCFKSPAAAINLKKQNKKGYYKTRDFVEIRKNNEIIFCSREDDIMKISGITVYCKDIELIVKNIKGVSDSYVYGEKDHIYGEVPVLIVEGKVSVKKVYSYLKDKLMRIQLPKKIYIFNKFPRTALLKIDRNQLKKKIK